MTLEALLKSANREDFSRKQLEILSQVDRFRLLPVRNGDANRNRTADKRTRIRSVLALGGCEAPPTAELSQGLRSSFASSLTGMT